MKQYMIWGTECASTLNFQSFILLQRLDLLRSICTSSLFWMRCVYTVQYVHVCAHVCVRARVCACACVCVSSQLIVGELQSFLMNIWITCIKNVIALPSESDETDWTTQYLCLLVLTLSVDAVWSIWSLHLKICALLVFFSLRDQFCHGWAINLGSILVHSKVDQCRLNINPFTAWVLRMKVSSTALPCKRQQMCHRTNNVICMIFQSGDKWS